MLLPRAKPSSAFVGARRVVGGLDRGALQLLLPGFLPLRNPGGHDHEPPRGGADRRVVELYPVLLELLAEHALHRLDGRGKVPCGDLLGAYLAQKISLFRLHVCPGISHLDHPFRLRFRFAII